MRAGYAEIMSCVIAGTSGQNRVTGPAIGGDCDYTVPVTIKNQDDNCWNRLGTELAFTAPTDPDTAGDYTLGITITDGAIFSASLTAVGG